MPCSRWTTGGAGGEFRKVANDLLGVDHPGAAHPFAGGPVAEDLGFREDDQFVGPEPLVQGCGCDAARCGSHKKIGQARDGLGANAGPGEELGQHLPAPDGLGREQETRGPVGGHEFPEPLRRFLEPRVGLQVRQHPRAAARPGSLPLAERDPGIGAQPLVQAIRSQEKGVGLENGALDVVGEAVVAALDVFPEVLGGIAQVRAVQQQRIRGQIVEQGGKAIEEQGQVVFDAARGYAGGNVLVDAARAHIHIECLVPAAAEAGNGGIVKGELPGRQHAYGAYPLDGALGVGVEQAQRLDFVVQHVDADRVFGARGKDIHERAANGELPPVFDGFHGRVAGGLQPGAFGVGIE